MELLSLIKLHINWLESSVGVSWVFHSFIWQNGAVFASYYKPSAERHNSLYLKAFTWRLVDEGHEFTTGLAEHELSILCANYESTSVLHPCMAAILSRNVSVFVIELSVISHELIQVLHLVVLIDVGASHNNSIVVKRIEGNPEEIRLRLWALKTDANDSSYL